MEYSLTLQFLDTSVSADVIDRLIGLFEQKEKIQINVEVEDLKIEGKSVFKFSTPFEVDFYNLGTALSSLQVKFYL